MPVADMAGTPEVLDLEVLDLEVLDLEAAHPSKDWSLGRHLEVVDLGHRIHRPWADAVRQERHPLSQPNPNHHQAAAFHHPWADSFH